MSGECTNTAIDNLQDIKMYIGNEIPKTVEKRDMIIDKLADRANGMFLYASFLLPQLRERVTQGTLRHDDLNVFPEGIAQIYEIEFESLFKKVGKAKYQKLLGPVMCKYR